MDPVDTQPMSQLNHSSHSYLPSGIKYRDRPSAPVPGTVLVDVDDGTMRAFLGAGVEKVRPVGDDDAAMCLTAARRGVRKARGWGTVLSKHEANSANSRHSPCHRFPTSGGAAGFTQCQRSDEDCWGWSSHKLKHPTHTGRLWSQ